MGSIITRVRIKWLVLITMIGIGSLVGVIYCLWPFPNSDSISLTTQKRFDVPIYTGFEVQGKNQCAAYSTAFVLRNSGKEAKGSEVYAKIPFKVPISGYVLPKGIISYLQSQGLKPKIYKGDLSSLKARLVQGSVAEIGYELMVDQQGKGIMQEAIKAVIEYGFKGMKLQTIVASPNQNNVKSINLLERSQFIRRENFKETDSSILESVSYSLRNNH